MNQSVDENTIRDYCSHHPLARPKVYPIKALAIVGIAVTIAVAISLGIHQQIGFSFYHCLDATFGMMALCSGKQILKFFIKCYQRYAPDSMRRQCTCMPSCSEYALLALDKYLWPKAAWKIWRRITHTCASPGYHIDYP